VFGVSFPELVVLGTVALLVLGPDKLPGMLRTMGQWLAKLRRLTTEVRHQSGIDEVLRAEGFDGGLNELRSIMRGGTAMAATHQATIRQPQPEQFVSDKSREYPAEGPDAYGALPEDLVSPAPAALPAAAATPALPASAEPAELPPAADTPAVAPSRDGLPAAALASDAHAASGTAQAAKP
jgi:sec-independent protein translocase protein TatB